MDLSRILGTSDINLKDAVIEETLLVDECGIIKALTKVLHEAETDLPVDTEAVAGGCDSSAEDAFSVLMAFTVDGLPAPGPAVLVHAVMIRKQLQHHEHFLDAVLILLHDRVSSNEINVGFCLAEVHPPALHGCSVAVYVLAPEWEKLLNSDGSLCVISAVLQTQLVSSLDDGVVHVERELVGDVEDKAQLPRVSEIHGQDVGGARHIHLAAGHEGKAQGVHRLGGELLHERPGEGAHHAEGGVQRGHVLDEDSLQIM